MFLVGGAVRDALLHLPVKDKDWVVIGSTPAAMLAKGFQQVGKDFPVFLHPDSHEEYALARTEQKSGNGYTGFTICSTPNVTLEQDLQRRDLTINAIAQDEHGRLFDPYNGQYDLSNRNLRHVSKAFSDDPLRVLRIARFAASFAHLNFRIVQSTQELMSTMSKSGELAYLTVERIWKETEKALLTRNPQVYFQVLHDCGALAVLFPELNSLFSILDSLRYYCGIDAIIHSLMTLSTVATLSNELDVRFATLFYGIKMLTSWIRFPSHCNDQLSEIDLMKKFCQRLHVPHQIRDLALISTECHDTIKNIESLSANSLIAFFDRIDAWRKPQRVRKIALISEANARTNSNCNIVFSQANYLRTVFTLACTIPIKEIISAGFKGEKIKEELTRRRIMVVDNFLASKNIA